MGEWDHLMKMLVRAHPQDMVSLVLQNTHYLEDITNDLKMRSIQADFLCKAEKNGKEMIVHVEFQKSKDVDMGLRTWEYNCVTTFLEKVPVLSFVIYLVEDEPIAQPPFEISLDEKVIHTFHYENIYLWEVEPEVLKQKGLEGLLPLLPLTKGAGLARDTIAHDMITGLRAAKKDDVLALGKAFLSLVYKTEDDQQAIRRIFAMLEDKLKSSWYYKEIIEEGEVKALRPVLIQAVETRFPELLPLAREEVERSTTPTALSKKVSKILAAKTSEEARQALQEN